MAYLNEESRENLMVTQMVDGGSRGRRHSIQRQVFSHTPVNYLTCINVNFQAQSISAVPVGQSA
jgi:hypothetical protein